MPRAYDVTCGRRGRKCLRALRLIRTLLCLTLFLPAEGLIAPAFATAVDAERSLKTDLPGGWNLLRTKGPNGAVAVAVAHASDVLRSDIGLVGLMIRCGNDQPEILVVLLKAFSFRARPWVLVGDGKSGVRFDGTVAPPGNVVSLPISTSELAASISWPSEDLRIHIENEGSSIDGVVSLTNLALALATLQNACAVR